MADDPKPLDPEVRRLLAELTDQLHEAAVNLQIKGDIVTYKHTLVQRAQRFLDTHP
jgi:hypothetical protein